MRVFLWMTSEVRIAILLHHVHLELDLTVGLALVDTVSLNEAGLPILPGLNAQLRRPLVELA